MFKKLGKWNIFVIESGLFKLDGGAMMGSVPKVLWEKTNPADELNRIDLAMRCLLIDDGENKILIESGIGNKNKENFVNMFEIRQSKSPLIDRLDEYGYKADEITHVILTHLHFDHAGGATIYNENSEIMPTFPNAEYIVSRSNWEAAIKPNPKDRASYLSENFIPLQKFACLRMVDDDTDIMDSISTLSFYGHTTGQQLIKIESEDKTIIFCADLIPLKSHLRLPWIMGYDLSAKKTLEEKTRFLNKASEKGWYLYFYHDPCTVAVKIKKGEKYFDIIEEYTIDG